MRTGNRRRLRRDILGRTSCCFWSGLRTRCACALPRNPQAGTAIEGVVAEVVGGIRNDARNASPDFAARRQPWSGR